MSPASMHYWPLPLLSSSELGTLAPINPLEVLVFPGICTAQEESEEQLQKEALSLFSKALENMQQNRRREGEKLATLVLDRMTLVEAEVNTTRKILPALNATSARPNHPSNCKPRDRSRPGSTGTRAGLHGPKS